MPVTLYVHLQKKDKGGKAPLYFSVTANSWQHRFSSGEKVFPGHFKQGKATKSQPGYASINFRIGELYNLCEQILSEHGRSLTKNKFIELLESARKGAKVIPEPLPALTFFEAFSKFLSYQKTKVNTLTGRRLHPETLVSYKGTMDRLKAFEKACDYPLSFEGMDKGFYVRFLDYMSEELEQSANTFAKHIARLKTFLSYCEDELELNVNRKYRKFEVNESYGEVDFLYEQELLLLRDFDFSSSDAREKIQAIAALETGHSLNALHIEQRIKVLTECRDLLLMACYTGMRRSDLFKLSKEHIHKDLIIIDSTKTGVTCYIPFYDDELFRPVELMEKYNYLLPANDNVNLYLQYVMGVTGINRIKLVTKVGRKTFTTLKRYQGVDDRTIMKATGHTTERSYLRYAGIDRVKLVEEFKRKSGTKGVLN